MIFGFLVRLHNEYGFSAFILLGIVAGVVVYMAKLLCNLITIRSNQNKNRFHFSLLVRFLLVLL
jgi:hypothetical protein